MTDAQFEEYYPRFQRSILAISRKIAGSNEQLFEDLVQVGRIALWRFDLNKVTTNITGCINRHLRNRMIDFVRAETGRVKTITLDDVTHPRSDSIYIDPSGLAVEARLSRHDADLGYNYWSVEQE